MYTPLVISYISFFIMIGTNIYIVSTKVEIKKSNSMILYVFMCVIYNLNVPVIRNINPIIEYKIWESNM